MTSYQSSPGTGNVMDMLGDAGSDARFLGGDLNGSGSSSRTMTPQDTPVESSTPIKRNMQLRGSAKLMRSASRGSSVAGLQSLLTGPVLITQPPPEEEEEEEEDDDFIAFSSGRMSRDTDYETDLEMDYEEWIADDMNMVDDEASQQRKYIYQCNETGVIPASYFLRHINNTTFRMRYHGLGPLGAKAIAIPLKDNHDIEHLDLEGNWIQREGATYMATMLRENMFITDINLSENQLGRDGADVLCEALHKNELLRTLDLSGNSLLDSGAASICELLKKNTFLKHLYLANNKFEDQAAHHFREALSHNETLETLDLGWNHFRTNGAVAIAEGVQENYGLRSLFVPMNGFSEPGAEALGRALKHNRTLTELDVSHNRIQETGAGHIALGLQTNDVLKKLKLGYNPISEDGALALLTAISKNDQSCINHIDLSEVFVSADFKTLQTRMETARMMVIIHAGVVSCRGSDSDYILETFRRNPYEKLKKYVKSAGYRLVDLFRDLDKDGSCTISYDELEGGLKMANVKITQSEIAFLMQTLDLDGDGMIDFSEWLAGDKEYRRQLREETNCPDDRKLMRDPNRFRKRESKLLDDIIKG
ncbi:LR74A-like protein [Mya arenaria]|uniref:LR74A-like protein n=1 Tax=Mya arenaria TaxID=6604 RepID=A0ABY7FDI9_MYAAR|nr:leucine-rich repeat-containing protein 74B-like [Mya arenaria]XP_052769184.1 leucine-rich repeat-containing protein 74B-like [Mya arenaria]XP_052769185.1 leucine-rich repeat-containing protein 74B-like [Mya arenaria]WAR18831.1 LR74A-like protein [Mya arenaria]